MSDITLCHGLGCPDQLSRECYRYRAQPRPNWQSYFIASPVSPAGKCEHFWSVTPWHQVRPVKACNAERDYLAKKFRDTIPDHGQTHSETSGTQSPAAGENAERRVFGVDTDTGNLVSSASDHPKGSKGHG